MPQCKFHKQNGQTCQAHAMRGSGFCFSHNPKARARKRAAVAKGGRNRRRPTKAAAPSTKASVKTIEDVQHLLFQSLEELRNGVLDGEFARSIGCLAGVATKVFESVEMERRVKKLESGAKSVAAPMGGIS